MTYQRVRLFGLWWNYILKLEGIWKYICQITYKKSVSELLYKAS